MKPREITLKSGTKIFLGRNAENNDALMKKFKGKSNIILHTVAPGSGFCVIDNLKPTKKDLNVSGAYCIKYSQAWRNKKSDTKIHKFTGKDIKKPFFAKKGTWKITKKPKTLTIKKRDVEKLGK